MADREKVLDPGIALSPVEILTDTVDIGVCGQLGIEIVPDDVIGGLRVALELSPDGDVFFSEPIEDTSSGVAAGNDLRIPTYRLVRTWSGTTPIAFFVEVAGYKKARLKVSVGTSGSAMIFINKLRLAVN